MNQWGFQTERPKATAVRRGLKAVILLGGIGGLSWSGAPLWAQETPIPPPKVTPAVTGDLPAAATPQPEDQWLPDGLMALPDARLWKVPPEVEEPVVGAQRPVVLLDAPNPTGATARENRDRQSSMFRLARDPLLQTSSSQAMGGGEGFSDGLGGIPGNLTSPLLPTPETRESGLVLGPLRLGVNVGLSAAWQQVEVEGASGYDQTILSLATSIHLELGEPASGHTASLNYSASVALNSSASEQGQSVQSISGPAHTGGVGGVSADPRNRFNQQLSMRAQYQFAKLELGIGVGFTSLSGQNRDVGREVARDLLSISLTSRYPIGPKTSLSWDLALPIREFDGGIGSSGFTTQQFVDYQYSPKTSVGIGAAFGWLKVASGSNQTFQQGTVRMAYELTAKVRAVASLGYEIRQAADRNTSTPIFTLGADWNVRPGTSVALTADQRVFNSASEVDVNYSSTTVGISVSQRLGNRFNASLAVGWEHGSYVALSSEASTNRKDNLYFVQAALATHLNERLTCSLSFGITDNESNVVSYRTLTAGLQGSFAF